MLQGQGLASRSDLTAGNAVQKCSCKLVPGVSCRSLLEGLVQFADGQRLVSIFPPEHQADLSISTAF